MAERMLASQCLTTGQFLMVFAVFVRNLIFVILLTIGVGGWSQSGIDAGIYSRRLSESIASFISTEREANKNEINLVAALDYGAACCKKEKLTGSTTACITSFEPSKGIFHVLNLGDSGVSVYRKVEGNKRKLVFKSEITTHGFNFPRQIGNIGDPKLGRMDSDTSKDAILESLQIEDGDIAVVGSDGLWDNLFDEDIEFVLNESGGIGNVDDMLEKEGYSDSNRDFVNGELDTTVKAIAGLALKKADDPKSHTPWSESVIAHYKQPQYRGGKSDDVTLLVTYFKVAKK
jgi:protein phosphatase PTC7